MAKRSRKSQDPSVLEKNMMDRVMAKHDPEAAAPQAVTEGKNAAAVALGKLGGSKGA